MKILEPVVNLIGQLSFRNKLRITALAFGLPLLGLAFVMLNELNSRVAALEMERAALAIQLPAQRLLAHLHLYTGARQGVQEGGIDLDSTAQLHRDAALAAVDALAAAFAEHKLQHASGYSGTAWFGRWPQLRQQVQIADTEALSGMVTTLRDELDKLNEATGLLIDGDASSSRLLDVITGHYAALVHTNGMAARLGTVTLVKQSVRGSRRNELTLLRGNFNALVQWSMETLQKVAKDQPDLTTSLESASSRMNAAYLGIQEMMTIKMLETTDYDLAPAAFIGMTAKSFEETLGIGATLIEAADTLLANRLIALQTQRDIVMALVALGFGLVMMGFIAAYISIMRGLNGLSDAVNTMASGDLGARVDVSSRDELGDVGKQFNRMAENLAERTAQLHEKTNDIQNMLHNMPQGILTIVEGGFVHPEYSDYLRTIFETDQIAGESFMPFVFGNSSLGTDTLSQIGTVVSSCIGEDRMNYDLNAHLLATAVELRMPDGRTKYLELGWSPICDDNDQMEKIMVCVRDVTELRQLEAEAAHQRRELLMIGQILAVSQEKFHEFVDSARNFLDENESLLHATQSKSPDLLNQLFRNMHTIKGNARTYNLLYLTNVVHEAEQAYDALRKDVQLAFNAQQLLEQLQTVRESLEEYASINEIKLGRKGPGRRGSAEKYHMVPHQTIDQMLHGLGALDVRAAHKETLVALLEQMKLELQLIGTAPIGVALAGIFDSLPSLAAELGKAPPQLALHDNGIHVRNQASDLLRNVFMHLYRNSMDHGIETPTDRLAAGKAAVGRIELHAAIESGQLRLRLYDDGKGLALSRIRSKALEKGLIDVTAPPADETVAQLIFAAGFSTASAVTEVSGRGVGMDAVRSFITREGGDIALVFTDTQTGADYRAFETIITLPEKFAVQTPRTAPTSRPGTPPHANRETQSHGLIDTLLHLPGKLVSA